MTTNTSKIQFLALMADMAGERATPLVQLAKAGLGAIELVGRRVDSDVAQLKLDGGEIEFSCYLGIHGQLYPEFKLDPDSQTHSLTGDKHTADSVIRTLRTCFRHATDLIVLDDQDPFDPDDETFVVDPGTEADLHEVHNT